MASGPRSSERLVDLLDIAVWKTCIAPASQWSTALFAVEQAVRARLGRYDHAVSQVEHLGSADDRILVHAEAALAKATAGESGIQEHVAAIEEMAGRAGPEAREFVAMRIATVAPHTSMELALSLPDPEHLVDLETEENPSRRRCLWRVFFAVAEQDRLEAFRLLETLTEPRERLHAALGAAHVLIAQDSPNAAECLGKVFGSLPKQDPNGAINSLITMFLSTEFAYLPAPSLLSLLDVAHRLGREERFPVLSTIPVIDDCVRRDSDACVAVLPELGATSFRNLVYWRLLAVGVGVVADENLTEDALGAGLARAKQAAALALQAEDISRELRPSTTPLIALAHTIVNMARTVAEDDPAYAQALLDMAIDLWGDEGGSAAFYSRLEAIRVLARLGGPSRPRGVEKCFKQVGSLNPVMMRKRAAQDLGAALASALGSCGGPQLGFLSWLVEECSRAEFGHATLKGLVRALPGSVTTELGRVAAGGSRDASRTDGETDGGERAGWRASPTFLSVLAATLVPVHRNLGRRLFRLAAERVTEAPASEDQRKLSGAILLEVFESAPSSAWEVFSRCNCDGMVYTAAAAQVLETARRRRMGRRDAFLRVNLEHLLTAENAVGVRSSPHAPCRLVDAVRMSRDPLAAAPNRRTAPNDEWFDEMAAAFRDYMRGVGGDTWQAVQLQQACINLAKSNWRSFMSIVHDPGHLERTLHSLSVYKLTYDMLILEAPSEQVLADVQTLRKATEQDARDGDSPLRSLKAWLLVCSAVHAPDLLVEMMTTLPRPVPNEFLAGLRYVKPEEPWSERQISRLMGFLGEGRDQAAAALAHAKLAEWLSQGQRLSRKCRQRVADIASACGVPSVQYEVGQVLRAGSPQLASEQLVQALNGALEGRDLEILLRAVGEIGRAFRPIRGDCAQDVTWRSALRQAWLRGSPEDTNPGIGVAAFASAISRLGASNREAAERALANAVRGVKMRSRADVKDALRAIARLEVIEKDKRIAALRAALEVAVAQGITCGPSVIDAIPDGSAQVAALTHLADMSDGRRRTRILANATRRASRLDAAACANALCTIADQIAPDDPLKATRLYIRALRIALQHPNASAYLSCAARVATACVQHGELPSGRVAAAIHRAVTQGVFDRGDSTDADALMRTIIEAVTHDPFEDTPELVIPEWKAPALLAAAICCWRQDRGRFAKMISKAASEFAGQRTDSAPFCSLVLDQAFVGAQKALGTDAAVDMLRDVLQAFDEDSRRGLSDDALSLCLQSTSTCQPMLHYHVGRYAVRQDHEPMIRVMEPLCSPHESAGVHLTFAVHYMGDDPERAKREIRAAMECSQTGGPRAYHRFNRDLSTMYAVTHGVQGCFGALREVLPDADNSRLDLQGIIAAAADAVHDPRRLLSGLWSRLQTPLQLRQ